MNPILQIIIGVMLIAVCAVGASFGTLFVKDGIEVLQNKSKQKESGFDARPTQAQYGFGIKQYFMQNIILSSAASPYMDVETANRLLANAEILIKSNNFEEALKTYEEFFANVDANIRFSPMLKGAWLNVGLLEFRLKKYDDVIPACETAIKIDPNYVEAWACRGQAYLEKKDFPNALNDFKKAVNFKPQLKEVWFNMGTINARHGQFKDAMQNYKKAVEIDPQYIDGWYGLTDAYIRLDKHQDALASVEKALSIKGPDSALLWNKSYALRGLGRLPEALQVCDNALALQPLYKQAWNLRGLILKDIKDINAAKESFKKAIEIDPGYQEAKTNLDRL